MPLCGFESPLLISIVFMVYAKVLAYKVDFVTLRNNQNPVWPIEFDFNHEVVHREYPTLSSRYAESSKFSDLPDTRYKLRYTPRPRLFWHKFPLPQIEPEPEPMTTTTEASEEIEPTTSEMPMIPETTTTQLPEIITTSTERPPPVRPPVTMKPPTTATTIMKPPFIHKFGSTLKNLLGLFGSPVQANLLLKNKNIKTNGNSSTVVKGKGKGFLSIFEVIKFANTQCFITMGDIRTMEGICYHEFECKSLGGIPTEPCGDGVGVCCIFLSGCGDSTNQAVTYFESPNYPNPVREVLICVLVVNLRENVQQLRLDFLMFELNRPTDGDCLDDQFIVSGQNLNFVVPILCGINTGHHLYIHVSNSYERKIYLSFFAKVVSGGRSFNIKVTQLESQDLAPDGCLQFYKEPEGIVKSFNYDIEGSVVDNREATYLNNLNYAICMERSEETCTVRYATEQLGGDQLDFQVINKDEAENDLVPDGQAGAGIFNCPDDYVAFNQVRLCGDRLNDGTENENFAQHAPIRDVSVGPIVLPVRTDGEYVGRGFRLVYKQESCV